MASNNYLYDQGTTLGLDCFIVKNPGQWGIAAGKNVMATTMEAIIGAVYYDSNKKSRRLRKGHGYSWSLLA